MITSRCNDCNAAILSYEAITFGSEGVSRTLCSRCFNQRVAASRNLAFEPIDFKPIELTDARGVSHRFHLLTRLLGDRVALDAFEIRNGERHGHQFQMIDGVNGDLQALKERLVERIERALAQTHLRETDHGFQIADTTVRARISSDDDALSRPRLTIDGRDIDWDEFGRMLTTFEGWSFKLELKDPSEPV